MKIESNEGQEVWVPGECFPLEGTRCEMKLSTGEWVEVEIAAIYHGHAIAWSGFGRPIYSSGYPHHFRPLKPYEDRCIESALSVINQEHSIDKQYVAPRLALDLYRAGLLKTKDKDIK